MDFLVHHMLRTSTERFPDKEAVVHGDDRLTYAAMWRNTAGLAEGLRSAGVARSDRVGVLLEPSIALATSPFAISRAGGVFVPIHHALVPGQVEHIIRDCQMKGLITDADRFAQLEAAIRQCPSLEFVVVVGQPGTAKQNGSIARYEYESFCVRQSDDSLGDRAIDKDLAAILYTSGSTGKPKGVMLSHANVVAGASIVSDYLGITETDRILAVLPFSFDAGLNQLTTSIQQGATCVVMKFLFAREIVAMLHKERITGLAGVPSLWNLLAQDSSQLHAKPSRQLRYITNTGGALPLNVLQRLRELLPATQVFLMYGLTEAFRSTYLPPEELDRRPTSIGKAIPNTEILVINAEGKRCGAGEIGELVHRGPTVSLGYWGHPELTARVLRPHPSPPPGLGDAEKVCYSGDLVRMDDDGFLYFVGRRDNLIKSSGFRISPNEVEEALCKAGRLREAAVIGLPDPALGQFIKAFVVAHEGASLDTDVLLEETTALLPRHMVPKVVEVLRELPKTSSGKIDYPELRRREKSVLEVSSSAS
ncbi:MAG: acyl-CoA ligase (AMP-forming), exosortase A system-associated [Pirellulales bacterium]